MRDEGPFEYVKREVKPKRDNVKRKRYRELWWLHAEPCGNMRESIRGLVRFIVTPTLTKYRLFSWVAGRCIPDHQLIVFARSDDYFFGVLHSSIHELWALRMGTQLEDRPRYTPTTCFETFVLPWPPGREPVAELGPDPHPSPLPGRERGTALLRRIAEAAKTLDEQRERWLNPPEWIEPIARAVDLEDDFSDVPEEARGLIRQSAIMARAAKDPDLKKRTLTNLYNERPTWLRLAHLELDRAVLAAYAAIDADGEWSEDWAEIWQETGAGRPLPDGHPQAERRADVDQRVLANLLRLNLARSTG